MPKENNQKRYSGKVSAFNDESILLNNRIQAFKEAGVKSERGILVLLISNPRDNGAAKDIYPKLPYINYRSGKHLEFLVTGLIHEGDKEQFSPEELIEVFTLEDGKYYFSDKIFSELITYLESITSWEYQGGSEIIVVDYQINSKEGRLNWSDAFLLDLEDALKHQAIFSVSKFIESLIRVAKNSNGSTAFDHAITNLKSQGKKSLYSVVLSFFPKELVSEMKKLNLFIPLDLNRR